MDIPLKYSIKMQETQFENAEFRCFFAYGSGRISGNKTVSRIFSVPSKTCKTRSMPMPQPEIGGMPYSIAVK